LVCVSTTARRGRAGPTLRRCRRNFVAAGRRMSRAAGAPESFEARVVAAFGRHFLIEDAAQRLYHGQRRGKRGDVVIGDRVLCRRTAPAQAAIESIQPRTSLLMRADGARSKALAANVDRVAVVFAPRPAFSERFIWRALLAAAGAAIAPLVVLNKTDLDEPGAGAAALGRLAHLGYPTLAISAKRDAEAARQRLREALGTASNLLVGQSGMGKSTLINLLVPQANARTQEYSTRLNLGRQTTTASRLFRLDGGGDIIDTPGFQAFGLAHLDLQQLAAAMPDLAPHLGRCRFNDCRHLGEPDCAVRAALARGELDAERYAFYVELAGERG
jgi:ribosome biogenesis GTPase